ncbi:16S rRNA (guanine1207-N2)-methyltransferase [Thermomonospora echinospora]|uniref:16S rRNA (Guanine1207-N2)-methyltransferase n=1 Tax=Thermomonospora echinospora TaxID=1992 RepID=A0A1H6DHA4_9ACTN|nr:methyltransferase [Thermomonospora echinospora]SEG84827.1 16S rRNA (guanine1207-N2)-methyltransferase [Thermomonospora echinospora]
MGEHYFAERPETASRRGTVDLVLPDLHLRLATDRGMFSPDRIDPGTRILLETVPPPPPDGDLLDLGCGYGPIALTMATRAPRARVYGVDVNIRALELGQVNAQAAGLDNVRFIRPGEIDPDVRFAALWSNPPIRIGKAALHDLLTTWLDRLSPGATAHLVVQKHLGSDSLHRWLDQHDWPTERIASRSAYRVLAVTARPPRDPAGPDDGGLPGRPHREETP